MTSTSPNNRRGVAEHLTHSQLMLSAFTVVLLLAGWSIFVWFGIGTLLAPPAPPTPPPSPSPVGPQPPIPVKPPVSKEMPYEEVERDLLGTLQRSEITARLLPLQKLLDEAQSLNLGWTRRIQDLRTSADGRRLATVDFARRIRFLEQAAAQIKLDEIRQDLDKIDVQVRDVRGSLPSFHEVDVTVSRASTELTSATATLRQCEMAIKQMLSASPQSQADSLQQVLDSLDQQDSSDIKAMVNSRLEKLKEAQTDAERVAFDRQRQLKADLKNASMALGQQETESAEILRTAQDADKATAKSLADQRAAAKKQLQQDYPAVRTLLTPFTSSGYRQLDASSRLVPTADSLPLSYSGLLRSGALEDTKKGLEALFRIGQQKDGFGATNDRSLGAFPELTSEFDIGKPDIVKKLKQAQSFLRTYGEAMVEAKLLSP